MSGQRENCPYAHLNIVFGEGAIQLSIQRGDGFADVRAWTGGGVFGDGQEAVRFRARIGGSRAGRQREDRIGAQYRV